MRNNLKHLALGMSLGAVVVFVYGINKLEPQIKNQAQNGCETTCVIEDISINKVINPEINNLVSWEAKTQVQFIEINRLNSGPTEAKNDSQNPSPTPTIQVATIRAPSPTPAIKIVAVAVQNKAQNNQGESVASDVIGIIEKYAAEYGIDKDMMIGIAKCESGFRENAVNGPYAGIYQFVSGTWISNRRAMGLDENLDLRFSAEESAKTAAFKMSRDGFGAWPVCQYKAQGLVASAENI